MDTIVLPPVKCLIVDDLEENLLALSALLARPDVELLSARSGAEALHIGGNGVWNEWFAGQLDDVRIYDQALSAAQVQTDMSTPLAQ